jgi:hypothetical protein
MINIFCCNRAIYAILQITHNKNKDKVSNLNFCDSSKEKNKCNDKNDQSFTEYRLSEIFSKTVDSNYSNVDSNYSNIEKSDIKDIFAPELENIMNFISKQDSENISIKLIADYYHYKFFTVAKPEESNDRKNEDSLKVDEDENSIVAVISDGAGGTGLLSADWSQTLVDNFIQDKPSKDGLDNWLGKIANNFMNRKNEIKDSFKRTKFMREGSSATLGGIVLDKKSNLAKTITYGDTPIFHFSKDWQLKNKNPKNLTLSSFAKFPYLLNWKDIVDIEQVDEQEWDLELGDKLIIASDGLAIFLFTIFLLQDESQKSKEEIDEVLKAKDKISDTIEKLKQQNLKLADIINKFIGYKNGENQDMLGLYKYYKEDGFLVKDDYSFIYIERKGCKNGN